METKLKKGGKSQGVTILPQEGNFQGASEKSRPFRELAAKKKKDHITHTLLKKNKRRNGGGGGGKKQEHGLRKDRSLEILLRGRAKARWRGKGKKTRAENFAEISEKR